MDDGKYNQERSDIAWVVDVKIEEVLPVSKEGGRMNRKWDRRWETKRISTTHASSFSSATSASVTASVNAITLCESTDAAADVVAEDAFVAGVGHC